MEITSLINQYICVFATRWGAHFGGINVFNQEMCIALKKANEKLKIVCVVDDYDNSEKQNADSERIELIKSPEDKHATSIIELLHKEGIFPSVWIGHDIYTGQLAIDCSKQTISISGVISHFDYELYASYKGHVGKAVEEKMLRQQNILKQADMKFAVGPKLKNTILRLIENDQTTVKDPIELSPGCFTVAIPPSKYKSESFLAMSSGRLGIDDDNIKRVSVVMEAFSKISKEIYMDKMLTIFGIEESNLEMIANNNKENILNIKALEFSKNRNHIFRTLSQQTMFIMPSIHEGFGLAGLEAISMEIPLILTRNSGLYDMLEKHQLVNYVYPIYMTGDHENDLNQIYKAMQNVWINKIEYKEKAIELKNKLYLANISWEQVGKDILNEILRHKLEAVFPTDTFVFDQFFKEDGLSLIKLKGSVENLFFEYKAILDPNNGILERQYGYILYQIISMYQNYIWHKEKIKVKQKSLFYELKKYMKILMNLIGTLSGTDFSVILEYEEAESYYSDFMDLSSTINELDEILDSVDRLLSNEEIDDFQTVIFDCLENFDDINNVLEELNNLCDAIESCISDLFKIIDEYEKDKAEIESHIQLEIGPLSESQNQTQNPQSSRDLLQDILKQMNRISEIRVQLNNSNDEMKSIIDKIENSTKYIASNFDEMKNYLIEEKSNLAASSIIEKKYINYCLLLCICLEVFSQENQDTSFLELINIELNKIDSNIINELRQCGIGV